MTPHDPTVEDPRASDASGPGPEASSSPADAPANSGLTTEQRATAFRTGSAPVDRAAALRAGRTPVPRKIVLGIAIGFAVIGLGGVVLEHYFGNAGVATSVTTTTISATGAPPPAPVAPSAPQIGAPLDAFLGLHQIGTAPAPDFTLQEPTGATWSLNSQLGKVVVLTFFSTGCTDICRVLGLELKDAAALLGPKSADVEFAVVNTDPNHTEVTPAPPALTTSGLQADPSIHFLTGSIRQLNSIWIDYGVTVTVGRTPTQETHNNILYFIDPQGRLRSSALPFANENRQGLYVLSVADTERFAQGIARTAANLTSNP
jgi:cytochrome oxidase Cu insertion factor (SCO1/SenC/PrrC family)